MFQCAYLVHRKGSFEPIVSLEIYKEVVELLLAAPRAEVLAAGVQQNTDKSKSKHMLLQLEFIRIFLDIIQSILFIKLSL